jgi:hypothetical protein
MIKVQITAFPEGIAAIRERLTLAGEGGEMVPVANVLRIVADLLDKKADVVAENPVHLARNTTFTFELQVLP